MGFPALRHSASEQIPAIPAPPGELPNFSNPYSVAPGHIIVMCIILPLMIGSLVARLYTRLHVTHTMGLDDCRLLPFVPFKTFRANLSMLDLCLASAVSIYLVQPQLRADDLILWPGGCYLLLWCGRI